MAVIVFGKAIKHNAPVRIGLAKGIFGIGYHTAERLMAKVGIYPNCRMNQLTEPQIMDLNREISNLLVEGHLKQKMNDDIALKRSTGSYAGFRHMYGFPVRGQNTKTNGYTARRLNKLERFRV
ncbi:37S ribosomal protein SWS2, mitochondrial [Candida viswanathii]|uniref:Small ribosomal subunit protein uS13m n=1 Tax=Candida viswanathii TaxID=5486 RepID=A0A367YBS7_9ASCO|nr:37S ribosomal protein SWS2, mitochondrial [Candida viswanathii]RCK66373.1 37S ribosomal protein SWS2, mitochondrial [Candida viswanathii]